MPYIPKELRRDYLDSGPEVNDPGQLTYIIYQTILDSLPSHYRYADLHRVIGALEAAKLEFYRRIVTPYEDLKIKQNGDVTS